jgi:hypothetical protein
MEKILISDNINNCFGVLRSSLMLIDLFFSNHECKINSQGCIINALGNSTINIINSHFHNVVSAEKDNIFIFESFLNASKVDFAHSISQMQEGSCLSSTASQIIINNSNFSFFLGNAIHLENSGIVLSNSFFIDICNATGFDFENNKLGAFFCFECFELIIENSSFYCNKGSKGGAIYLINNKMLKTKTKIIRGTHFFNNQGEEGGSINLHNQDIDIEWSIFQENKAIKGGAIYSFLNGI